MILIQQGSGWKPKVDAILDNNLAEGIIWDPREENIEKFNELINIKNKYIFIDTRYYYFEFNESNKKQLIDKNMQYYPDEKITVDKTYLRNTDNLKRDIEVLYDMQVEQRVSYILANSLYLKSFDERKIERVFDILDITAKYHEEMEDGIPLCISLLFSEEALDNKQEIDDLLTDLDKYRSSYKGVYLVVDRTSDNYNNGNIRGMFKSKYLCNLLNLIYSLKLMGFEVIIGYTGLESFLYKAAGASFISTGWFYSLRKFNKEQKGLDPNPRQGRMKRRYTSSKTLTELKWEYIDAIPEQSKSQALSYILNGTSFDNRIYDGEKEDDFKLNETYIQYYETINSLTDVMGDDIEINCTKALEILEVSKKNIANYNSLNLLNKITDKHITEWYDAMKEFQKENYFV